MWFTVPETHKFPLDARSRIACERMHAERTRRTRNARGEWVYDALYMLSHAMRMRAFASHELASHASVFCANAHIYAHNGRKRCAHTVCECAHDVTTSYMMRVTMQFFISCFFLETRLDNNKGELLHMFTSTVFVVAMIFISLLPSRSKAFCFVLCCADECT